MGVLILKALLFGVCTRVSDFWKLPNRSISRTIVVVTALCVRELTRKLMASPGPSSGCKSAALQTY